MRGPELLRTKVARRLLGAFLLSAVLPVAALAVLGYRVMASQLEVDAREKLRQDSKSAGIVLYERLEMLASSLREFRATRKLHESSAAVITATFLEHQNGEITAITGTPVPVPRLTARQANRLEADLPVLFVVGDSNLATLLLVIPARPGMPGTARLWAAAQPSRLLGSEPELSPEPTGTTMCIVELDGPPVWCPADAAVPALRARGVGWLHADSSFLMGRSDLFLRNLFGAQAWTVAISRPAEAVFAPMDEFRRLFLLTGVLAGLVVFILSHSQLRRRMAPLLALESGVRRLETGDFSFPVQVSSDDEFELLADSFNRMTKSIQHQIKELGALSEGALLALARTIDANSHWTAGHSERVTAGALEIGRRMNLDSLSLDRLRRGGLLHDIGKIGVPTAILDKAGPLTEAERKIVQAHPTLGAAIILPIDAFEDLLPLVRSHHELLDGTGYPEGHSGDAIPDLVRILTVADVFDALVSDRPYRKGLAPQVALDILSADAPAKFDSRPVAALAQAIADGWSAQEHLAQHPSGIGEPLPLELAS